MADKQRAMKSRPRIASRTALSLFTGAGGLDLGFEAAGFETRVAVEFDTEAAKTLRQNRDWTVLETDIHSEAAASKALLRLAKLKEGDADVLIGGPPCQPFSKSGYWARGDALRLADPRASTLGAYLRVLRDTLPRAFLLENVPGITFSQKNEGLIFLQREIEKLNRDRKVNYSFSASILRASEFGVPQERHRVFVVGHREGLQFKFPLPTHGDPNEADLLNSRKPFLTAWDAIGDLELDDDPALKMTGKWAQLLPTIPEGLNYLHHTARGAGVELFGWRRRYWNFLLKLAKNLPSWTIAAQPGPAIGPFHWKNRRLSPRELCRLQTFPDTYKVTGSLRAVQRQIGNAVPSAIAEKLAWEIRRQLFGDVFRERGLKLIPKRRGPPPPPEPTKSVPKIYRSLINTYDAHPGTGLGYAAMRR